jgi:2-polyprenyl-3-methyl-5-hydroxy-6-metoxy-1,4-benzoquinol methylase
MSIYREFAQLYNRGEYAGFSLRMAELLPDVLGRLQVRPQSILDVACGDGAFAVAMAGKGYSMTGVDSSPDMLRFARQRAERAGVEIEFVQADMRAFELDRKFDLATCWYDSLNYLTEPEDLAKAMRGVCAALRDGSLFIFDMNSIYGLAVTWQQHPCYVMQDEDGIFEVHQAEYDHEANIATMKITGFLRQGTAWLRVEEEHKERGYARAEVETLLQEAGFQLLACWGNFGEMSEPRPGSGRIWYVAKRIR